ncbi:hypothetical protein BSLG_005281 [Batrachochytrium salamandrivorans]|nr:hypothetical protein BSLG_005281 [Batrachochytrium salamandrivorans]
MHEDHVYGPATPAPLKIGQHEPSTQHDAMVTIADNAISTGNTGVMLPLPEETRLNYLDIIRERFKDENKMPTTCIVVIVGEISKDLDRAEFSSNSKVVYSLIRDIGALPQYVPKVDSSTLSTDKKGIGHITSRPMMFNTRILTFTDNNYERFYPFWASKVIDLKENSSYEIDMSLFSSESSLDKLVSAQCICCKGGLNIGKGDLGLGPYLYVDLG